MKNLFLAVFVCAITAFLLGSMEVKTVQAPESILVITGEIHTNDPMPEFMTPMDQTGSELTGMQTIDTLPAQEIQKPLGLAITATFTDEFVQKYKYEDSTGYRFAVNIDGKYYNTFRNHDNGVSNSINHGLTGAIPAYLFKEGYTWHVPFGEINVANNKGSYGFHKDTIIEKDTYNITMSPVKEGVQTHDISYSFYY